MPAKWRCGTINMNKYETNWTYTNDSINMVSIQADLSHSVLLHAFTVFFQHEKTSC